MDLLRRHIFIKDPHLRDQLEINNSKHDNILKAIMKTLITLVSLVYYAIKYWMYRIQLYSETAIMCVHKKCKPMGSWQKEK